MSFFGKKPRTAQQKAQMAKTNIMLRSVALGYLVFFIIWPLINADPEEMGSMNPAVRWGVIAFFVIACTWLGISTALEYVRNKKAGKYSAEGHTDDEGVEVYNEPETPSDDDDDDDDDEYDDDDDEYDDDDDDYDDDDDDYDDDDDEYDDDDDEYDEDED